MTHTYAGALPQIPVSPSYAVVEAAVVAADPAVVLLDAAVIVGSSSGACSRHFRPEAPYAAVLEASGRMGMADPDGCSTC